LQIRPGSSPRSLSVGCPCVLRLGEAQPQPFQGEPAALTDDEVVEQLDIEQLPGRYDLHGEGHISCRRRGIPRRVVVDGDQGGGLLAHRVAEDFSLPP
jgi:hypothetical protein